MFRKIICFAFLFVNLWAFDFKPIYSKVYDIDGKFIYIQDNPQIQVGASAVVMQKIKNANSIISRASVVQKSQGLVKLELKPFTMLEQKALPVLDTKVQKGDEVIVNFLYDRALLIAPNEQTYQLVTRNFNELYFVHPDILGAYMIREFKLSPKKKDFNIFCSNNAVGVVGFVLEDRVYFVDCADFTLLFEKTFDGLVSKPQTPFYSHINEYKKNFFNFFEWRVKDYYIYYKKMIGLGQ